MSEKWIGFAFFYPIEVNIGPNWIGNKPFLSRAQKNLLLAGILLVISIITGVESLISGDDYAGTRLVEFIVATVVVIVFWKSWISPATVF